MISTQAVTSRPLHPALPPSIASLPLSTGEAALLRPALPQDTLLAQHFVHSLSPRSHRRRFHGRLPALCSGMLAAGSLHGNADEGVVAVVAVVGEHQRQRIVGEARFVRDAAGREAEFALVVCDRLHRQGLGRALMRSLQQVAAAKGVRWLRGEVHLDNPAMLNLLLSLGFRPARSDESAGLVVFEQRLLSPGG